MLAFYSILSPYKLIQIHLDKFNKLERDEIVGFVLNCIELDMATNNLPTTYSRGKNNHFAIYTGDYINNLFCSILDNDITESHSSYKPYSDDEIKCKWIGSIAQSICEKANHSSESEDEVSDLAVTQTICRMSDTSDSECDIEQYRRKAKMNRRRAKTHSQKVLIQI